MGGRMGVHTHWDEHVQLAVMVPWLALQLLLLRLLQFPPGAWMLPLLQYHHHCQQAAAVGRCGVVRVVSCTQRHVVGMGEQGVQGVISWVCGAVHLFGPGDVVQQRW